MNLIISKIKLFYKKIWFNRIINKFNQQIIYQKNTEKFKEKNKIKAKIFKINKIMLILKIFISNLIK